MVDITEIKKLAKEIESKYDLNYYEILQRYMFERILERMPLLVVSPGVPVYMPNYSTDAKQNVLTGLIDQGMKGVENILNDIIGKEGDGRFYSFKHAY